MTHRKLITDLNDKNSYIIYYRNLQQCLQHCLILKKIHRILQFNQSNWLKKYIDVYNHHRTLAKNTFKHIFCLLNNAVYEKAMENFDKSEDIKIVIGWENRRKRLGSRSLIAISNFHSSIEITDEMVAVEMSILRTEYIKPIYIGFSVLELSKWKMNNFHYNLCYMDTDSFVHDMCDDITNDIPTHFHTSAYSKENVYNFLFKNKKVLGMMKDECNGKVIRKFFGLPAKMYSAKIGRVDKEIKKLTTLEIV